jgi:hypothetical protein
LGEDLVAGDHHAGRRAADEELGIEPEADASPAVKRARAYERR